MSGHTPGPWEVRNTGRPGVWKEAGASWVKVASVEAPDAIPALSTEKRNANARLISAAPELLEAARKLEMVVRLGIPQKAVPLIAEHGLWDEFVEARIRIEEAINKAEGRE